MQWGLWSHCHGWLFSEDKYVMTEEFFTCYTLVDITNTGAIRYNGSTAGQLKRDQQRNWETLVQSISLRAQPIFLQSPVVQTVNELGDYDFGSQITGPVRIWSFVFGAEHRDIYSIERLMKELHQVPVTVNLTESICFSPAIFDTRSEFKNTYFALNQPI
ncbi:hypothetical protein UFOVP116_75 [uncultured Caudovirales phage]|uniref:Uncharacterized protein n=1 Tax=uncultured Caudovirales phage TaxID=2100421 RepID=A0A6J5L9H3_9CAUD|nr:hypothetical protein UFOVP116_75 [uncultured Caudovirales phage]